MEKSSAVLIIVNFNIPYKKMTVNNDKSQTKKIRRADGKRKPRPVLCGSLYYIFIN